MNRPFERFGIVILATLASLAGIGALRAGVPGDPRVDEAAAALRDGDAARAAALCESVLLDSASDADALVLLAQAARRGGDLLSAENRLDEAIARSGSGDRGRFLLELGLIRLARGQALAAQGRGSRSTLVALFRDAVRALEAASEAGAKGDDLVIGLADALDWAEEPDKAENCLRDEL